jgi:hypothetical protein
MSQSVIMAIDPQPELLCAFQQDLQRHSQKLEVFIIRKFRIRNIKEIKRFALL